MNQLIKNIFAVIVIALLISLAGAAMGRSCGLVTSEVNADSNEPGILPEMVLNVIADRSTLRLTTGDSNEPSPLPEMKAESLGLNVISEDSDDEPAEMVPTCSARAMSR